MRKILAISVISGMSILVAACSAPTTESSGINVPIQNSQGDKVELGWFL